MTPELAATYPTPESLMAAPLIFDQSISFLDPPADWPVWFAAMGIKFAPDHGPSFSQADHAIDAALAGVGAVLGRRYLCLSRAAATADLDADAADPSLSFNLIETGTIIRCDESGVSVDGRHRVRCDQGWVSLVAMDGQQLLDILEKLK